MTEKNKVYMDYLRKYIDEQAYGDPILLKDVTYKLAHEAEVDLTYFRKLMSLYLNRLVQEGKLEKIKNGVFYKTKETKFGNYPLNFMKLLHDTYIYDYSKDKHIGYRIGTKVLNDIGISNNIENWVRIVSNKYNTKEILQFLDQKIEVNAPPAEINDDNYLYFQLLDTIKEINEYHLIYDRIGEKLETYMKKNKMSFHELMKTAKMHYNKNVLDSLTDLMAR